MIVRRVELSGEDRWRLDCDAWRHRRRALLLPTDGAPVGRARKNARFRGSSGAAGNADASGGTCGATLWRNRRVRACVMLGCPANKTAAQVLDGIIACGLNSLRNGPDGDAHVPGVSTLHAAGTVPVGSASACGACVNIVAPGATTCPDVLPPGWATLASLRSGIIVAVVLVADAW